MGRQVEMSAGKFFLDGRADVFGRVLQHRTQNRLLRSQRVGHGAHDVVHLVLVALLQCDFGGVGDISLVRCDHAVVRLTNAPPVRQSCDGIL